MAPSATAADALRMMPTANEDGAELEADGPEGQPRHGQSHVPLVGNRAGDRHGCPLGGLETAQPCPDERDRGVDHEDADRARGQARDRAALELDTRETGEDQCRGEQVEDDLRQRVEIEADASSDDATDRGDRDDGHDDVEEGVQHIGLRHARSRPVDGAPAKPLRQFCVPIVVAGEVQPHAYRVGDRDAAHVTSIAGSQAAGIGPELERRRAFTVGVVRSFLAETARDLARVTGHADVQRARWRAPRRRQQVHARDTGDRVADSCRDERARQIDAATRRDPASTRAWWSHMGSIVIARWRAPSRARGCDRR